MNALALFWDVINNLDANPPDNNPHGHDSLASAPIRFPYSLQPAA